MSFLPIERMRERLEVEAQDSDTTLDVCRDRSDIMGELHAVAGMSKVPGLPVHVVSSAANGVNQRTGELTAEQRSELDWDEKRILLQEAGFVEG